MSWDWGSHFVLLAPEQAYPDARCGAGSRWSEAERLPVASSLDFSFLHLI